MKSRSCRACRRGHAEALLAGWLPLAGWRNCGVALTRLSPFDRRQDVVKTQGRGPLPQALSIQVLVATQHRLYIIP